MPNNKYISGRNLEYAIMKKKRADKFTCVRSAGSHGKIDILALKPGRIELIQAKKGKYNKMDKNEEKELFELAKMLNEKPIIAVPIQIRKIKKGFEEIELKEDIK